MSENLPQRPRPQLRVGDADRDQVLGVLQSAYADGRLDITEFEERQEKCLAARYDTDLAALVSDLPEGRSHDVAAALASSGEAVAPAADAQSRGYDIALMSGKDIQLPASQPSLSSFAMWGGHDIHLNQALGPGRVVELNLSSFMGGYTVRVPAGVRVVNDSICIMAGVSIKKRARGDGSGGTLILKGFHFWGGVEVKLER